MLVKTKAIVIASTKYQEKSLIVKCFTQSDGLKSYFVANAFSSKKGSQKIAYFQPMTLLEIEANHKNKGTLEYFKEIKIATPYNSIPTNVYKSTIVLFLSEVLHSCIQEEEKNEDLYVFIQAALEWLDNHDDFANFHLVFLLQITKFLGFYPQTSALDNPYFDLDQGEFISFKKEHALNQEDTNLLKRLLLLTFADSGKKFSRSERYNVIDVLLKYYQLQLNGFKKPISLGIIVQIFENL